MVRVRMAALSGVVVLACSVSVTIRAQEAERAHFHHIHLNVEDVARSIRFYSRVFGAVPVRFGGGADALFTERSFILFNEVEAAPPTALRSGIWHIGWGGVDVAGEYEWWKRKGVSIHTPLRPLPGEDNYYFYLNGPDKELVEINTMGHHRFAHVHLLATDVNKTTKWYAEHLGLEPQFPYRPKPKGDMETFASIWINIIRCDNVSIIIFGKPDIDPPPSWWPEEPLTEIQPTDRRPIAHVAFSYRKIAPVFERMKRAGVDIVRPIAVDDKLRLKSFFVRAPDKVLVEIVEAKPIPEGFWE